MKITVPRGLWTTDLVFVIDKAWQCKNSCRCLYTSLHTPFLTVLLDSLLLRDATLQNIAILLSILYVTFIGERQLWTLSTSSPDVNTLKPSCLQLSNLQIKKNIYALICLKSKKVIVTASSSKPNHCKIKIDDISKGLIRYYSVITTRLPVLGICFFLAQIRQKVSLFYLVCPSMFDP